MYPIKINYMNNENRYEEEKKMQTIILNNEF